MNKGIVQSSLTCFLESFLAKSFPLKVLRLVQFFNRLGRWLGGYVFKYGNGFIGVKLLLVILAFSGFI